MVSTEVPQTLSLKIETRTRSLFRRKKPKVKKIVLVEGDGVEIDRTSISDLSPDGSSMAEGYVVRTITISPETGPVLRTEFHGVNGDVIDQPLVPGKIHIIKKTMAHEVVIKG